MERITNIQTIEHEDGSSHDQLYCFGHLLGSAYFKKGNKDYEEYIAIVKRLAEYEDLEEQGKLLILPSPNWMDIVFGEQETFWGIDTDYMENSVREITVDNSGRIEWYGSWETVVLKGTDENGLDWEFSPVEIGITVFTTREQAEEALKKIMEENSNE